MKTNWIFLAFVALSCFSVLVSIITVLTKRGLPLPFILMCAFGVSMVLYFAQTWMATRFSFEVSLQSLLLLLLVGVLAFIGNWAQFQAAGLAPNPGLAIAVVSLQSGLIALIAVIFFKEKLTLLQTLGLVVTMAGIMLISVGGKTAEKSIEPASQVTK
jgi:drug/metabolite transporter (DMT)-like permease